MTRSDAYTRFERRFTPRAVVVFTAAASVILTIGHVKTVAQVPGDSQPQTTPHTVRRISITVNESGGESGFCCRLEPEGRVTATNATLRQLIQAAYMRHGFDRREVDGGPPWIDSTRFDVIAEGREEHIFDPDGLPRRTWAMLQTILADRFGLRLRTESRPAEVYLLLLARSDAQIGPRIRRSDIDCAAVMAMEIRGQRPERPACAAALYPGRLVASALTVPTLSTLLSGIVNRPVIDRTGLAGLFDIELEAVEIRPTGPFGPSLRPSDTTQSILETLPAQLGLRLEQTQGTVDVLVVERAEKPAPG